MGAAEPIKQLKVSELRALGKEIGLQFTGKEKKVEILLQIEAAAESKLNAMTQENLKILADSMAVDVSSCTDVSEFSALLKPALGANTLRTLFGIAAPEANPATEGLEEIGDELVELEKDMEGVIHHLEGRPAPDMADIYLIDQKLADVVKMNVDYTNIASMLDVGRIKFLDRKYVESMTMLTEALKASEDMISLYNDITQAFIILSAEKILEECRDSKLNDENAADALIHAKRAFSMRGQNRQASIKELSETARNVHREEVVYLEQRMAYVEPLINAMKVQGVDVFNAERYIHRAREAFLIGELSSVASYLEKSLAMANDSKQIWIQEIRNDIPRVDSIIRQASELGADISAAEKHLQQAKTAFDNQDYSLCSELKKQAERKAMESQHAQIQKAAKLEREKLGDAEKILNALVPMLREAEAYGINVFDVAGAMNAARTHLMNNDYVNALTYARDAETRSKPVFTQIKAQRETILSSGQPLLQCHQCRAVAVKLFPNKAVCANCGMVHDMQAPPQQNNRMQDQKKGWFKK